MHKSKHIENEKKLRYKKIKKKKSMLYICFYKRVNARLKTKDKIFVKEKF